MPRRVNLPLILAFAALLWCVFLAFALLPAINGAPRFRPDPEPNWRGLVALLVAVALASLATFGAYRERIAPIAVALILMCAFVFITGFSIGAAYVPATALMAWSLVASAGQTHRTTGS